MANLPGQKITTRYSIAPGAKLTIDQIKAELLAHGMRPERVAALETHLPDYAGHLRCINRLPDGTTCGAYSWNHGELLRKCSSCGWCRHASTTSGPDGVTCDDCQAANPSFVEMTPDHHEIHWLDESGKVVKKTRH